MILTKEESEWIKNTCPRERKKIIENLNRHKSVKECENDE